MQTSVCNMNRIGESALANLKSPESPSGVSVSLISSSHLGWVKSPVPTRLSPLIFAYFAISGMLICSLVARLYLPCMCRSAMTLMYNAQFLAWLLIALRFCCIKTETVQGTTAEFVLALWSTRQGLQAVGG